jgi:16S rRNA (guanine527-N7)-methyltransferase
LNQVLLAGVKEMNAQTIQKHLRKALNCSIEKEQAELLSAHLFLIIEHNKTVNLTGIKDKDVGLVLHIEDSLTALPELEKAPEGRFVDLGSGAGFPGVPLAIVTGRDTVLVEATGKKATILQKFVQDEGLGSKIEVEALRAEELARRQPESFAVATARALSSLPALMELATPLLQKGGVLLAYKGQLREEELEHARSLEDELGMTLLATRVFTLSDKVSNRALVQFQKTGKAKRPFPRRPGQAQHHPLCPGSSRP